MLRECSVCKRKFPEVGLIRCRGCIKAFCEECAKKGLNNQGLCSDCGREDIIPLSSSESIILKMVHHQKQRDLPENLTDAPIKKVTIVPFKEYYPTFERMDPSQKMFFRYWKQEWENGNAVDVEGNISYLFVYLYEITRWHEDKKYDLMIEEFSKMFEAYKKYYQVANLIFDWMFDTCVLKGDYKGAIARLYSIHDEFSVDRRGQINRILNLKYYSGIPATGKDYSELMGIKIPIPKSILENFDLLLDAFKKEYGKELLQYMGEKYEKARLPYYFYQSSHYRFTGSSPFYYYFWAIEELGNLLLEMWRDAWFATTRGRTEKGGMQQLKIQLSGNFKRILKVYADDQIWHQPMKCERCGKKEVLGEPKKDPYKWYDSWPGQLRRWLFAREGVFYCEYSHIFKKSRSELLKDIKDLVEVLGFVPTKTMVDVTLRQGLRLPELQKMPSIKYAYEDVFGNWIKALIEAGVLKEGVIKTTRGFLCIAKDGHECKSLSEKQIDDWLYNHGVKHVKEPKYPCEFNKFRADWLVGEIYIEFFGLKGEEDYDAKMGKKKEIANKLNIKLLELYSEDLLNLDEKLNCLTKSNPSTPLNSHP